MAKRLFSNMKKLDKDFYIGSPEEEHIADSIHLFMKGEVAEDGEVNKITSVKKVKNGEPIELIGSDSTIDEKAIIYGMLGSNSGNPGIALFTDETTATDYALTAKFNQDAYYSDTLNYSLTSNELLTVIKNPSIGYESYGNKWVPYRRTPEVFASEEIVSKCKEVFYNYLNNWIRGCTGFAKSTAFYTTGTNLPNLGVQLLVLDESAATTGVNKRIYLGTVTGIMRGFTSELEGDSVSITIMLAPYSNSFSPPVSLYTTVTVKLNGAVIPPFPTIGDDTVWRIEAGQA